MEKEERGGKYEKGRGEDAKGERKKKKKEEENKNKKKKLGYTIN